MDVRLEIERSATIDKRPLWDNIGQCTKEVKMGPKTWYYIDKVHYYVKE